MSFSNVIGDLKAQNIPLSIYQDTNTQWYMLREKGYSITFDYFMENYQNLLGLSSLDHFQIKEQNVDFYVENREHIRLKQFYGNYEIEDAILLIHITNDTIDYINADLVYGLGNTSVGMQLRGRMSPLSESLARKKAFEFLNITPPSTEQLQKAQRKTTVGNLNGRASIDEDLDTLVPNLNVEGRLLLARKSGLPIEKENYVWAWKYILSDNAMDSAFTILIDAATGNVADVSNAVDYGMHRAGTVSTLYYGDYVNDMNTFKCDFCTNWELKIDGKFQTYLGNNTTPLKDNDNVWVSPTEKPATTAHWAMEKIWYFWNNYYGRNSFDNLGSTFTIQAGRSDGQWANNAGWMYSHNMMILGVNTSTGQWYSTLDIMGHEFMHGITRSIVGGYPDMVNGNNEQGAIREALSDIMGMRAEFEILKNAYPKINHNDASTYASHNVSDINSVVWSMGDKVGNLRDMSNPTVGNYNQIANYWYLTQSQKAYYFMGIVTKWYVKLSVEINLANAADIVYFALRDRSTNSTDFTKFKNATITQAQAAYGLKCNSIAQKVLDKWKEVGVAGANENLPGCLPVIGGGGGIVIGRSVDVSINENDLMINNLIYGTNQNLAPPSNIGNANITFVKGEEVRIYPVPTKEQLHINIPSDWTASRYILSSLYGAKIFENTLSSSSNIVNVSALEAGTYILSIYQDNNLVYTQRVMIL